MRFPKLAAVIGTMAVLASATLVWKTYGPNWFVRDVNFISFAPMLQNVLPAVVSIKASGTRKLPVPLAQLSSDGQVNDPVFAAGSEEMTTAGGSGSIIDAKRGLIYTNAHVVKNSMEVVVKLANGREVAGRVLGADAGTDVAVVQIEAKNLTALPFGNSDKLRVGDFIVIAGSPYGLAGTAKMGMVSALMRSDVAPEIFESFIQIDAVINPGNSGGAMVTTRGELAGVVAASIGNAGETSIGFVIPINMARSIADQIVAGGVVRRGGIGFAVQPLSPEIVKNHNLPFAKGAVIMAIAPNSAASKTEFTEWDVIVGVNGRPIEGASDYLARIASIPIGKPVALEIYSKGRVKKLKVVIDDLNVAPTPMPVPGDLKALAGLTLGMLLPGVAEYGMLRGVRVLSVAENSPAALIGLAMGDIITKVGDTVIATPEDAFAAMRSKSGSFRVDVSRRGQPAFVDVAP